MTRIFLSLMTSCFLLQAVGGSVILLNTTSKYVKPLVSRNLTVTCLLEDTAPLGPAIGKRSVPRTHDILNEVEGETGKQEMTNNDVTKPNDLEDLADLDDEKMTEKSVTQTPDDVLYVTSIVLTLDNHKIATISEHFPVRQLVPDVAVSGHLTAGQGERGRLEVTWPHPSQAATGLFQCDVTTLSSQGDTVIFSQSLNVAEAEVSLSDVISKMHQLEVEKENMQLAMAGMSKTIVDQASTIRDLKIDNDNMNKSILSLILKDQDLTNSVDKLGLTDQTLTNEIQSLNLTNQALLQSDVRMTSQISMVNQSLTSLADVARVEPDVFFTAAISSDRNNIPVNQVLVFDQLISREGQGYDSSSGIFTAPVDGFYEFHIHAVSDNTQTFYLSLLHNGSHLISLVKPGDEIDGSASNSVIVKLNKQDQVKVVCQHTPTYVYDNVYDTYRLTTFSGRLISLA